jgi:hypothetical protein
MQWTLHPANTFSQHKSNWDKLNEQSQNLAILHSDFVEPLIEEFFEGDELLALGYIDGKLKMAGLFHKTGVFQWATVMPSQAPVALWLSNNHEFNSRDIKELANSLPGLVLSIDFLQVDSRDMKLDPTNVFELSTYIITGNRPVPADFEEYFKSLGKNMRQNYNKVINRAAKAGDALDIKCVTEPADIADAVRLYGEIESQGWKAQKGTAVSPDNDQGRFYTEMLTRLAKRNQACCWYYLINEQVVAVDLCINQNGSLIILKTTYNEEFSKQSPALQLKVEMLKHYAQQANEITNIEFYGRVMEWHTRLDSVTRELLHVTWYSYSLLKSVKKFAKSVLDKKNNSEQ